MINQLYLHVIADVLVNGISALPKETQGACNDEHICTTIRFNQALCGLQDIKEKCCEACALHCQDGLSCETYHPINTLCRMSKDVRHQCPRACGLCEDLRSK